MNTATSKLSVSSESYYTVQICHCYQSLLCNLDKESRKCNNMFRFSYYKLLDQLQYQVTSGTILYLMEIWWVGNLRNITLKCLCENFLLGNFVLWVTRSLISNNRNSGVSMAGEAARSLQYEYKAVSTFLEIQVQSPLKRNHLLAYKPWLR